MRPFLLFYVWALLNPIALHLSVAAHCLPYIPEYMEPDEKLNSGVFTYAKHHLDVAHAEANSQIDELDKLLKQPKKIYMPHIINTFGLDANVKEIKKVVKKLKTGTIKISKVHAGKKEKTNASSNPEEGSIKLYEGFYAKHSHRSMAGTLIHEATHALAGTHDFFSSDGKFTPKPYHEVNKKKDYSGNYSKSAHWSLLVSKGSKNMHHNADSYKLIAHTAKYGLDAPLPQAELLQRKGRFQTRHRVNTGSPEVKAPSRMTKVTNWFKNRFAKKKKDAKGKGVDQIGQTSGSQK
ncbi:hypothetical protein NLJ89_g10256 [Agrocybe chaxingu]|uniref:Lysine-specific metallo-endopeptidase domain-containing protein n=1 Tax=Agrocybe chaxingu TaxID=84603 RepID=A0A9W8MP40_9AGAR|nr:hypothetical protein NLJ89_g10256 [Agrocybe chaxingu]